MKKIIIFVVIVLTLFITSEVKAEVTTLNITCESAKVNPNKIITCQISGKTQKEISGLSAKIQLGNNLKLEEVVTDESWEGDGEGGKIDLYTDTNKIGSFSVATVKIKALETTEDYSTEIKINNISYSDKEFQLFEGEDKEFKILITKNINTNDGQEELPDSPQTGFNSGIIFIIVFLISLLIIIIKKTKNKLVKL